MEKSVPASQSSSPELINLENPAPGKPEAKSFIEY